MQSVIEKLSLDQLRKLLIRIERQLTEDELFMESVREGTRQEPSWKIGSVRTRMEQKREERQEVKERIELVLKKSLSSR
jgi:hypothetical protein